jgi:formate dehydrogenase iron-sulfur subunit
MQVNRRDFIKFLGAGTAIAGIGAQIAPPALDERAAVPAAKSAVSVLIDLSRCIGCRSCQAACKKKNGLPQDDPVGLSATTLTFVEFHNTSNDPTKPLIKPIKRQCMNCVDPACVSACTVGALQKQPNGPVTYDSNRCIGCRYCMYACPFGIPTFEWRNQLALIKKCDNCADLVAAGQQPACVQACPAKALQFGKREEMLAIAKERISDPKANYVKEIYGEDEVGGTSMMYLSALPFERYGLRNMPEVSPAEVNREVMHLTPFIGGGMALALSIIYFIFKPRGNSEVGN